MKLIVTGGAGFIGSSLIESLLSNGHTVIAYDNLHSGNVMNLVNARDNPNFKFIPKHCRLIHDNDMQGTDIVIHLGIPSSSNMYKLNPHFIYTPIIDLVWLYDSMRRNDVSRMIYASSSSLYNGWKPPHKEEMIPAVTDYYTETRYYIERLSDLYNQMHEITSVGLRFFSVYGPKETYKKEFANIVSQFLWTMQKDISPVIYGNGTQTRDFTYITDVVQAIELILNSNISQEIYNVGTGVSYSYNDVVGMLNDILNKTIIPEYVDIPLKNYVHDTCADITKIKSIGYAPEITLYSGIHKLLI